MASPVVPLCISVKVVWSGTTRTWLNALGAKALAGFPTIDQTLVNNLHADVGSALTSSGFVTVLAPTVIFERVLVRSLNAENQPELASTGTPVGGAGAGDMLPLSNACCVTLRTLLAGKSFRGRVYLSGFAEASNDTNGRIVSTSNDAAAAFVTAIDTNFRSHGFQLAVLSRASDAVTIPAKTYAARAAQGNGVTSAIVRDTRWESQRRRLGRA